MTSRAWGSLAMFIGHFAVGLAAKRIEPGPNLAVYFLACQLLDLIWPVLVLLDVEQVRVVHGITNVTPLDFSHYPYSHSLLMALTWSVLAGLGMMLMKRSLRTAGLMAAVVLSHWLLDFLTHRPDLPIGMDGAKVGLGLWNSVPGTVLLEGALFALGVVLYCRAVILPTRRIKVGFWALISFLSAVYALNVFGPVPPENTPSGAIAGPALAMWLLVAWAYFVDRRARPV